MSPKTKKRLLIAGGIVGGAAVVFGAIVAVAGGTAQASGGGGGPTAPTASDSDIDAVAQKALAVETDPAILRELARYMLVIPWGDPLRNYVGRLQARADEIEALHTNVNQPETFKRVSQI